MIPLIVNGPAVEPVALPDAKKWLKVETFDDDDVVGALITAARLILEAQIRRMLITQTWRLIYDRWPNGRLIKIPLAPFQSLIAMRVYDANGTAQAVSSSLYHVDARPDAARIIFGAPPPPPGQENAAFQDGLWRFFVPQKGWIAYVESEGIVVLFDGSGWNELGLSLRNLQNLSELGIGTSADATNVLAAKLNNALFTAKATSEGGTGNLRYILNKSAVGNTVSQLYQDGYSGRAEVGLIGDDNFHVKVSADGSVWHEAISVDKTTGKPSSCRVSSSPTATRSPMWRSTAARRPSARALHVFR